MTESTGFTIRVVEVVVSIPAGRAMRISKVSDLVEGAETSVTNVLREHMDSGLPWWRIVADDGAPVFGSEFVGRALERYLLEATPIVPSASEYGFAVNLDQAAPDAAAVASLETSLNTVVPEPVVDAQPVGEAQPVDGEDSDDRIENAPAWVGAPVSARAASAPAPSSGESVGSAAAPSEDAPAEASSDSADAQAAATPAEASPGFAFDALLHGEQRNDDQSQQR